ncbi:PREDICTED: ATP-dependent RNA helicase vasa isoform X1 [Trachymyrmex cornetzi]|uniref:RNA helicase n=1 Tax=Trachymyrmex cornetzi TaxID=471704 RepID=A0A151IY86_9HYME|nr:PREDICTED: ATP-dependent RNA helicase vasa isoform X1 [Trachymyrmex cornetzi]KYN13265.1 ATP-dependent RNA helicase vasa, isoform A [Trachymyrmex cornetzi]
MEEQWGIDDTLDFGQAPVNMSSFEEGRAPCRGKGRGAILYNNNDTDCSVGGSYNSKQTNEENYDNNTYNEDTENNKYNGDNNKFGGDNKQDNGRRYGNRGDNDRRWQGNKDRNNSRRNRDDNGETEDNGFNGSYQNDRKDRPRRDRDENRGGRGGGYGRNRDGDDNDRGGRGGGYGRNRDGDDNDRGGRGGGYGRNRDGDDNDRGGRSGGYGRNRDGDDNDRGGRGGGYGRNRDGDDNDRGGRGGGYGRNRGDDDNDGENRRRRRNDDESKEDDDKEEPKKREIYIPPEQPDDENSLFGNDVTMGINFNKYDDIEVKVSGENAPRPIQSFNQSGLRTILLENITKSGYTKPTPVQKYAIPIIISGRDLMACAQTGSGKTAAFVVPILHTLLENPKDLIKTSTSCEPHVIIISPTRELTSQIHQQVKKFSLGSIIRAELAYGGTSVMHQSNRVLNGCHILVATPGRLLDFIGRGKIRLSSLRFLVLDEADRMLDMGFLPDIEKLIDHETMAPAEERQTLMFSATFPNEIQELAGRFLRNYLFVAVGIVGGACADVEQNFYQASGQSEKRKLLKELIEKQHQLENIEGTLVFVEQKRHTDFIAAFLSESNFPTTSIHGDRLQREREEALYDFKRGKMLILVATAVAARGLDIKNVSHVINFDLPKTIDEYVHRIGRTGRVGNRGKATSFFDSSTDMPLTDDLMKILKQAGQPVPDWLESGGGGGSRTFMPGKGRRFGGEDIRGNKNAYGDETYEDAGYAPPTQAEPEEEW